MDFAILETNLSSWNIFWKTMFQMEIKILVQKMMNVTMEAAIRQKTAQEMEIAFLE